MTDLINSLKTLASSSSALRGTDVAKDGRRRLSPAEGPSTFHSPMRDVCTESGFAQWRDAMRMVARLPGGLPTEFRLRLWENLADRWLTQNGISWEKLKFKSSQPNSRDHEISEQIDKDLHRTGCVGFSGPKQVVLKEVLLAFSRWNGEVGYCQGLNMIGATLLQMTSGDDRLSLKILIFVIEGVLPQGYFSQGLRGLAIDMAVFREILKSRKPTLHAHLSRLQKRDDSPPLTDVFTMHWFLTLFIHCLPTTSVLRIWDLLLLEGSEVLLRTALVLWAAIETRVLPVQTTDEFYSVMGVITREMIEFGLLDPNSLVKCIVSLGSFPYPGLQELRERHRNPENLQKSFFLPKKELDSLKRHYAAIRHRQRNTTIILKNMETVVRPKPKTMIQRNIPNHASKRSGLSPKPKVRRQNSSKLSHPTTPVIKPQVTLNWDKTQKKAKKPRKRRLSSSSMTTSSSSTELCDSDSGHDTTDSTNERLQLKLPPKATPRPPDIKITPTPTQSLSFEETEAELILLTENSGDPRKPIDTSDSQYFLDELSRIEQLRKSYGMATEGNGEDNFYENLSQRICQLQFQNLTILTHFTGNEKEEPRSVTPLPSPISPILSFHEHFPLTEFPILPSDFLTPPNRSRAPSPGVEYSSEFTSTIVDVPSKKSSAASSPTNDDEPSSSNSTNEDDIGLAAKSTTETRDEITNIIRENLEILQRLKLKGGEQIRSEDSSSDSSDSPLQFSMHKQQNFNPFPTSRKPRTKTSKFGLYK